PPIERELQRINRCADILLFTQPGSIRSWHPELVEFLGRSSPNLVVANHYALSGLSEFGASEREFVARHDKRLLRVHSDCPRLRLSALRLPTSRPDPASRASSRFCSSPAPGGFSCLGPMAVRTRVSANVPISTTTTTTPTSHRGTSSTDLA